MTMCDANLPSVSCVSVQSSNTSERVKRPQSDAISEYVYSGANQNLNRPHVFPGFFFFSIIFPLLCNTHGIFLSGVHFTLLHMSVGKQTGIGEGTH